MPSNSNMSKKAANYGKANDGKTTDDEVSAKKKKEAADKDKVLME